MKKAIIIGHSGQDGTYLFEYLKEKNYSLVGISGSSVVSSEGNKILRGKISDSQYLNQIVNSFKPDEIYYLAAVHQSSIDKNIEEIDLIKRSFEVNTLALANALNAIKTFSPHCKLFYAASSHIFGTTSTTIQNESTPLNPNCIYGISKVAGINLCHFYKENHNIYTSVGIFYNHESPLRHSKFVSKKIVEAAIAIKYKKQTELILGNLNSRIDWGYAMDYIEAAYQILQLDHPDDFIISSGETHSVLEFVQLVFEYLNLNWENYTKENPDLLTKNTKNNLFGDNTKLKQKTGWKPSVDFKGLVKILVDAELNKLAKSIA